MKERRAVTPCDILKNIYVPVLFLKKYFRQIKLFKNIYISHLPTLILRSMWPETHFFLFGLFIPARVWNSRPRQIFLKLDSIQMKIKFMDVFLISVVVGEMYVRKTPFTGSSIASWRASSPCGFGDIVWQKGRARQRKNLWVGVRSGRRGELGEWEGKESLHGKPHNQHFYFAQTK